MIADLDTTQFCIVLLSLFISSIIQGSVGFATGMISIPIMLAAGIRLPEATTITLLSSSVQNIWGWSRLRKHLNYRETILPISLRLAGLPVGLLLLQLMDQSLDTTTVRQIIGVVILAIVIIQWILKIEPKERIAEFWKYLTFPTSGVMQGAFTIGGPPIVLWVMAHKWPPEKSRAFFFFLFMIGTIPNLIALSIMHPDRFVAAGKVTLLQSPAIVIGTLVGLWLGSRFNREFLRKVMLVLLIANSISAIVAIEKLF